ncbi:MAG: hypothetical protein JJU02_13510 [Cryomorphaceae bacterium]|nr:hypothetical protein [Cryomorphaceae bacterium]
MKTFFKQFKYGDQGSAKRKTLSFVSAMLYLMIAMACSKSKGDELQLSDNAYFLIESHEFFILKLLEGPPMPPPPTVSCLQHYEYDRESKDLQLNNDHVLNPLPRIDDVKMVVLSKFMTVFGSQGGKNGCNSFNVHSDFEAPQIDKISSDGSVHFVHDNESIELGIGDKWEHSEHFSTDTFHIQISADSVAMQIIERTKMRQMINNGIHPKSKLKGI